MSGHLNILKRMGPANAQRAVRIHMTFMQTQLTQSTKENVYIVHALAFKLYTYHHLSLNLTLSGQTNQQFQQHQICRIQTL
jgi:hypothetical protein